MNWLTQLMAAVNMPGAHVLICTALLVWAAYLGDAHTKELVMTFTLGVLARSMGAVNQKPPEPPTTDVKTTVVSEGHAPKPPDADPPLSPDPVPPVPPVPPPNEPPPAVT